MSKGVLLLQKAYNAFEDIDFILHSVSLKPTKAIDDKVLKPAIRMHIVKVAEQFQKLKDENEFAILEQFETNDLRGLSAVRNYIAHDYDSVDDHIIEDVLRYNFPKIKKQVIKILKESKGCV